MGSGLVLCMRTESIGDSDFPWLPLQGVPAVRLASCVRDRPTPFDLSPHARLHPPLPVLHGRAHAFRIHIVLIEPADTRSKALPGRARQAHPPRAKLIPQPRRPFGDASNRGFVRRLGPP